MARENLGHLRQIIAQEAARMMAEDGVSDFAYAKKKAGRQLGISDNSALPSNAEIESATKYYHEIYNAEEQPLALKRLREAALATMKIFERFNPFLSGSVLEGIAGKNSQTDIHLFADSAKDVEMFLLNKQIPFDSSEKVFRLSNKPSRDKKDKARKTVPAFTLETEYGLQKLSVFEFDDLRVPTKKPSDGSNARRINIVDLQQLMR